MTGRRLAVALSVLIAGAPLATAPAMADPLADCQQTADPDLAIDGCTTFLSTVSGDQAIQPSYARALAYFNKHDFYHAAKDFTAVLVSGQAADGYRVAAYANRGIAYANQMADDPTFADKALSDLNQALALKSDLDTKIKANFALAYATRAATELASGQDAQAGSDEDAAVQLNPDKTAALKAYFAQAYMMRARLGMAAGQYDRATSDLQQAMQLDPTLSVPFAPYLQEAQSGRSGPYSAMARGDQLLNNGQEDLAVGEYTQAIRANQTIAEVYLHRAHAYDSLNRQAEARADFDQAVKLDPSNWSRYYERGKYYQSLDQFDQARSDFNQASTIADQSHDAGFDNEKKMIDEALKSVQFDNTLSDHWVSYLKEIQVANDYPNWSAAPYDLYAQSHNLAQLPPPPPPPPPAAAPPVQHGLSGFQWTVLCLGIVLALGAGGGAFVYYRRRGGFRSNPVSHSGGSDW